MALEILDITLVYVKSAVAFYVDFYESIVESMTQFGLWVWEVVSSAPSTVAQMVHEAQEAFRQLVDWALEFIRITLQKAVDFILGPILTMLDAWAYDSAL
ncbi:MAG: hypothetical protein V3U52_01145, partial [Thermoplasmata archaeon]